MSYTKLDMQHGTIDLIEAVPIDEIPQAIESLKSEYERAKAVMGNPLLDTRGADEAMKYFAEIKNGCMTSTESLRAMVEFYQNTLVMLSNLRDGLDEVAKTIHVIDNELTYEHERKRLYEWRDKIAAILEAHKQHMPEGL